MRLASSRCRARASSSASANVSCTPKLERRALVVQRGEQRRGIVAQALRAQPVDDEVSARHRKGARIILICVDARRNVAFLFLLFGLRCSSCRERCRARRQRRARRGRRAGASTRHAWGRTRPRTSRARWRSTPSRRRRARRHAIASGSSRSAFTPSRPALEERAKTHDDAGAEAAMFLLEAGASARARHAGRLRDPSDGGAPSACAVSFARRTAPARAAGRCWTRARRCAARPCARARRRTGA